MFIYNKRLTKDMYIAIDVGATKIVAGIFNNGRILKKVYTKTNKADFINTLTAVIDSLFSKKIKGIGIGMPSITYNGYIYETANIGVIKNINLAKLLEKRYKVKVKIDNDVNCYALGHKYFGLGKRYNNFVAVTLGSGLGTGIIINNKIYRGVKGSAGEFGHVHFKDSIIEDYCSEKYFKKVIGLRGKELYDLAIRKDKKALKVFKEFGNNLGLALSMIVASLSPEAIIIGGSISKAERFFEKYTAKTLTANIFPSLKNDIKVVFATDEDTALKGAASLLISEPAGI